MGVELRHDGDGDMMAELITLDETMDYSFYDPMFAVQSQAAQGQVAISFDLSGAKNTLLVFKNTTGGAVSYVVAVQYEENGELVRYEAQPATLMPQAPGVINLRTLRDRGFADSHGRVLPPATIPTPPFPVEFRPDNPTIIWLPATLGSFPDFHSTPGNFVKPYVARTVIADQTYRYRCTNINGFSPSTLRAGITITREVPQKSDGTWKFTTSKSGVSSSNDPLP